MTLSADELDAMKLTTDLVNLVCQKVIVDGPTRDQDVSEFCAKVHEIQRMLMAQSAAREYPGTFRLLGEAA